jgi:hypothetical protein
LDEFYHPHQRAPAVGKLVPGTEEENAADDRKNNLSPNSLVLVRKHTISGFYGYSGAMIAIPGKDADSCKVIGLCKF